MQWRFYRKRRNTMELYVQYKHTEVRGDTTLDSHSRVELGVLEGDTSC